MILTKEIFMLGNRIIKLLFACLLLACAAGMIAQIPAENSEIIDKEGGRRRVDDL